MRAAILSVLAEEPSTGYGIMQALHDRTEGAWHPSPGSVYPTLEQLVEDGLARQAERDGGKVYALTPAGEAYVETHRDNLEARCEAITACDGEGIRELRSSASQLMIAVFQVGQAGTEKQQAAAQRLLEDARRAMYRILADEPGGDESAGAQ